MEQKLLDIMFMALCLWREARGESNEVKVAISHVIKNRYYQKWGGRDTIMDVVLHPWQFSGMTATGDPNLSKFPRSGEKVWEDCLLIAEGMCAMKDSDTSSIDPTMGAVFYHDISILKPPKPWGPVTHTLTQGRVKFYKGGMK